MMKSTLLRSVAASALIITVAAEGFVAPTMVFAQTTQEGEQPAATEQDELPKKKIGEAGGEEQQPEGNSDGQAAPQDIGNPAAPGAAVEVAPAGETTEAPQQEPAASEAKAEPEPAETPNSQQPVQPVEQSAPATEPAPAEDKAAAPGTPSEQPEQKPKRRKAAETQPGTTDQPAPEIRAGEEQPAEPAMTVEEARKELEVPATVSQEAEQPKPLAAAPIEEQVKRARQEPTAVVPDQLTDEQRRQLAEAEAKRREEARRERGRLLGAAAVGVAVGALVPLLGGRIAADEGDRIVVEQDGYYHVRKDESALLRDRDVDIRYERMRGGYTREIVTRGDGVQIVSVRDPGGELVRRIRIERDGTRMVLFDSFEDGGAFRRRPLPDIPSYRIDIPRDDYIVSARRADRRLFRETFEADPVYAAPRRYSLSEIREFERVRSLVRRVDLDTVTFDTGSAYVSASQVRLLGDIAGGMLDVIDERPESVFLVEGHTDAVGGDIMNLVLSDRRAESVARILVEAYGIPPENLVMQGYGEKFLKVDTQAAERANRRVTIRNITPILEATAN